MNGFEFHNRQQKVAMLLRNVPASSSLGERERMAVILSRSSQQWRDSLAAVVGCHSPSPTTWAALVDAVRARPLAVAHAAQVSA